MKETSKVNNINNNKIKYILPDFLNISRNEMLIKIYKKYSHITVDNTCIYSFYGNFPSCIWNGGRLCLGEKYSVKQIKTIKNFYNKHGIVITLTMTNLCLEKKHLSDEYSNKITNIFNDGYNEVLVASELLEEYIRVNYSKYKINKSITYSYLDNKPYEINNYHLTVLDKRYNNNFNFLNKIPYRERCHIEILCDELCFDGCVKMNQHYKELSMKQLGLSSVEPMFGKCKYDNLIPKYSVFFNRDFNSKYYVSLLKIKSIYSNLGYKYFKLSCRNKYNMYGLQNITSFLIKECYLYDVQVYLLERFMIEFEVDIKNGKF